MKFVLRPVLERTMDYLQTKGIHPLWSRLYAGRGIKDLHELDLNLKHLLPPDSLLGINQAVSILACAIKSSKVICIIGDYDCDGATAAATAILGLQILGAKSVFAMVPDRKVDGYGLTPILVDRALSKGAEVLVTVDNGIASLEGVRHAHKHKLQVVITDHHLPGHELPLADAIVNPNQPGCPFPSKNLAGVGVIFYVLVALRQYLRKVGDWEHHETPKLDHLLPLVALGTIADLVKLDQNNRCLVFQGLKRIHQGLMPIGMKLLLAATKTNFRQANTQDFGYAIAPRINAAGRMANMAIGIECLTTNNPSLAEKCVLALEQANQHRKTLEISMHQTALEALQNAQLHHMSDQVISLFAESFHPGIIGIIASKLKEKYHQPAFIFAPKDDTLIVGSGRSIPGIHLRDVLDLMSKKLPNLFIHFGGHAMAAGCTIQKTHFGLFHDTFLETVSSQCDKTLFNKMMYTDGHLDPEFVRSDIALGLAQEVWGQGFDPPVFQDSIKILSQRLVGDKHLKVKLELGGKMLEGIWFNRVKPLPSFATYAYRLLHNEWTQSVQINLLAVQSPLVESNKVA
ncbi:MAG: single-stranded-DNA-specific exonuclease RecJ [Gammaproteobacteria bacterium]|nr:single-stranded-DNA-specific exonuclease RecJ [Gammaproteobacteria bacterium]